MDKVLFYGKNSIRVVDDLCRDELTGLVTKKCAGSGVCTTDYNFCTHFSQQCPIATPFKCAND